MSPSTNSSQHWFVIDLVEKTFEGPFSMDDLKQNLTEQKIFWSDLAMCPGRNFEWVRLFEIKELVDLCPPIPPQDVLKYFRNVAFKQSSFAKLPLTVPVGYVPEAPMIKQDEVTVARVPVVEPPKPKIRINSQIAGSPTAKPAAAVAPAPKASSQSPSSSSSRGSGPAEWFMLIDDQECGPFTVNEIETAFNQGKSPERAYVWKSPMRRWKPIAQVAALKHLNLGGYGADFADEDDDEDKLLIENFQNMRRAFRKTFIASVMRISESGIKQMIGVCGNITTDGLHLHQDSFRVEYRIGSKHQLEIKPIKLAKLPPFRVTAEVRWVDAESFNMGFQFLDISPTDQKLLQRYLDTVHK